MGMAQDNNTCTHTCMHTHTHRNHTYMQMQMRAHRKHRQVQRKTHAHRKHIHACTQRNTHVKYAHIKHTRTEERHTHADRKHTRAHQNTLRCVPRASSNVEWGLAGSYGTHQEQSFGLKVGVGLVFDVQTHPTVGLDMTERTRD